MKIFVLVFGGIGLILLAIAGYVYYQEQSFLGRAELATGTVSDFTISTETDGTGRTYCPKIDFTTKDGQQVLYYANVCSSPPAYEVGQQVEVYYDPHNIKDVQMNDFWSQYVGVIVLSCIGLPFFALGIVGILMAIGAQKPQQPAV
jgi:hypothetical protein